MSVTYEFDKDDGTWVACLRKGAFRKMCDGSHAQPIARVASGLTKDEAKRNLQGPDGPNVRRQYDWPDDPDDDVYHMQETPLTLLF